jgi:hypothetical protein
MSIASVPYLEPLPATFATTVSALHRVAEQIVAPARKPDNEIALAATPGGFGTPEFDHAGRRQQVRVEAGELVHRSGDDERRGPLTTLEDARRLVAELLPATPLSTARLDVDAGASARLGDWYAFGAAVLGELADSTASPVRLWPEHFDIAIELGDDAAGQRANYGFSPGDADHDEPYAYVGPWTADVSGELWRATGFRGAELTYSQLLAAADPRAAALNFFTTRRDALAAVL